MYIGSLRVYVLSKNKPSVNLPTSYFFLNELKINIFFLMFYCSIFHGHSTYSSIPLKKSCTLSNRWLLHNLWFLLLILWIMRMLLWLTRYNLLIVAPPQIPELMIKINPMNIHCVHGVIPVIPLSIIFSF